MIQARGVSLLFEVRRFPARESLKSAWVDWVHGRWAPPPPMQVQALRDISFDVAAGETLGILGANGSGKSTLLRVLGGILPPDSGEVRVDGAVAPLIELGAGIHPELTGRENIVLNGALLGMSASRTRERMEQILAFAELEPFADVPLRAYSSGMTLRLAFSVAVHSGSDVLLIDEVLSVGDERFQQKCFERIGALQKAGMTIVIVSHDRRLIEHWCRRALWLDRGIVRELGPSAAVSAAYGRVCAGGTA